MLVKGAPGYIVWYMDLCGHIDLVEQYGFPFLFYVRRQITTADYTKLLFAKLCKHCHFLIVLGRKYKIPENWPILIIFNHIPETGTWNHVTRKTVPGG